MSDSGPDVAAEAKALVEGDRQEKYGHPILNFGRIADFWTTWLADKLSPGERIDVRDVGPMMTLLKLAREMHEHQTDNIIDGCGYLQCHEMIHDELARREAVHDAPPTMTEETTTRLKFPGQLGEWTAIKIENEPAGFPHSVWTCEIPACPECKLCDTPCKDPSQHAPVYDGQSTSRGCGCPLKFPTE